MKIVVGASLSVPPFSAGTAWDRMQYVLGLRALGHEAYFVEEVKPDWCLDRLGNRCSYERSANRAAFYESMKRCELLPWACQLFDGGRQTTGLTARSFLRAVDGADLLLNISGHVKNEVVLDRAQRRAYLDQDPVYTQLWHAAYGADIGLEHHEVLLTVGLNIGTAESPIPDCGRTWHHTVPPVLPELWRSDQGPSHDGFTTVSSWGRYGDLEYQGRWYRSKQPEFLRFADLPTTSGQTFELVLRGAGEPNGDVARLRRGGWCIRDSRVVADLASYRRFIARSRAEIGIAKGAYVEGRAGWIGDRSCHYLASGRPVLAESTGIERRLPTGNGLLTFSDEIEALEGIRAISADYRRHSQAAHRLAEEFFDYRRVLPAILESCAGGDPVA
jgi:hypothetical protein